MFTLKPGPVRVRVIPVDTPEMETAGVVVARRGDQLVIAWWPGLSLQEFACLFMPLLSPEEFDAYIVQFWRQERPHHLWSVGA